MWMFHTTIRWRGNFNNNYSDKNHYQEYLEKAYHSLKESINLDEKIGFNIIEDEHKIGFIGLSANKYSLIIPLCIEMKEASEGLEYLEKSKSKALLDMLSSTTILPRAELQEKYHDLLEKEYILRGKLKSIQTRQLRDSSNSYIGKPFETLINIQRENSFIEDPGELEIIQRELDKIYDIFYDIDSDYVSLRRGTPDTFNKIRGIIQKRSNFCL